MSGKRETARQQRDYLQARGWRRLSGAAAQVWRSPNPTDDEEYTLAAAVLAAAELEMGGRPSAVPHGHEGQGEGQDPIDERAEAADWIAHTGYACPCCGSPAGIAGSALTGTQRVVVEHVGACPRGRLLWPLRSRPQWTVRGTPTVPRQGQRHTTAAIAA